MHKVEYVLKPEYVEENGQRVRAVFEELNTLKPTGLRYACIQGPDGRTVIHFVASEPSGGVRLPDFPAFKKFSMGISDLCESPPQRLELQLIGAYDFFHL
jgi:hypothetical protein